MEKLKSKIKSGVRLIEIVNINVLVVTNETWLYKMLTLRR